MVPDKTSFAALLAPLLGKRLLILLVALGAALMLMPIGVAVESASLVNESTAMRAWAEVPATIERVQLHKSRHTSHTGKRTGETLEIYMSVEYRYEFDGRQYLGTRATLYDRPGKSASEAFDGALYDAVEQAHHAGTHVPCYVNPTNPYESTLERDVWVVNMVFKIIFALGVAVLGWLLARWSLSTLRSRAQP